MTTLSMLAVFAIFVILTQYTLVDAAQDLTRYYNCVTMDANNQGSLSLAMLRFDMKVFSGTQTQMMMTDP